MILLQVQLVSALSGDRGERGAEERGGVGPETSGAYWWADNIFV